jgi:hypothetical protein
VLDWLRSELVKKSLFFAATLVAVAVFGASACSYSDEADNHVRNLKFSKPTIPATLSDDCVISEAAHQDVLDEISWDCLNDSQQEFVATYLYSISQLISHDDTSTYPVTGLEGRTNLLELLLRFDVYEILCYTQVFDSLYENQSWPIGNSYFDDELLEKIKSVRYWLDRHMSDFMVYNEGSTSSGSVTRGDEPVLETLRYQHLCPSWVNTFFQQ